MLCWCLVVHTQSYLTHFIHTHLVFFVNWPILLDLFLVRLLPSLGIVVAELLQAGCPLPVAQPTASKHWRMTVFLTTDGILPLCCQNRSGTLWWLRGLPCYLASRQHHSYGSNSVTDLKTACCYHAVMRTLDTLLHSQQCQNTDTVHALLFLKV